MIGKHEWLFYIDPNDGNNLEDYRKNDRLTPEQLQQWRTVLETKYWWLQQQGISYVFVIAPNKQSIYGEYFPSRIRAVGRQSRLEQLMEYMKDSEVPILDLRKALIRAKAEGQIYQRIDTHWNDFGAAIAQYEIMRYLTKSYPNIQPIRYAAQDFLWESRQGGDLANMLNLSGILKEQSRPRLRSPASQCEKQMIGDTTDPLFMQPFMTTCLTGELSALIFRDSFFAALQPYISSYFSKSVYVWTQPDIEMIAQLVEQYAPNIVIEERVERYLKNIPAFPQPKSEAYQVFLERQFQAGTVAYQFPDHHKQEFTLLHRCFRVLRVIFSALPRFAEKSETFLDVH